MGVKVGKGAEEEDVEGEGVKVRGIGALVVAGCKGANFDCFDAGGVGGRGLSRSRSPKL